MTSENIAEKNFSRLESDHTVLMGSVLCSAQVYLSDRGALSQARGAGGGVVRIVEGLLVRVHGNFILPIESMVTQFGHPFIKQLLRFNLPSRYGNQKSTQGQVRWRRREGG